MKTPLRLLVALLGALEPGAYLAAAEERPELFELESYPVEANEERTVALSWPQTEVEQSVLLDSRDRFAGIPGIAWAERGPFTEEPVIRGMGLDRVATTFGGLSLSSGSPTRTHAPIARLRGSTMASLEVVQTLPSLTLGPPVSGAWIVLEPESWGPPEAPSVRLGTDLSLQGHPDREGLSWNARSEVAGQVAGIRIAAAGTDLGNFRAGDGREIRSRHRDLGASLSARIWPSQAGRVGHTVDALYQRQFLTEHASLPLDTIDGRLFALAASHTWQGGGGMDRRQRLRYGYSDSLVELDNSRRGAMPLPVRNRAETSTAHFDWRWRQGVPDLSSWELGLDANTERRLAVRERGAVGRDFIWPDVRSAQWGLFAETHHELVDGVCLRLGLRWDHLRHRAAKSHETAFGVPLRELYSIFNDNLGMDPGRARTENLFGANILLQGQISGQTSLYFGMGRTHQAAPPTERFRALLQALGGGFEVGNPALVAERKTELVGGVTRHQGPLVLRAEGFVSWMDDYIWRQRVGSTAGVLPLPSPQLVYGYRNVDALFAGFDLAGCWHLSPRLRVPFAFSWVQAHLREDGEGFQYGDRLPETPPVSIRATILRTWERDGDSVSLQWTVQWTGARRNALPQLVPLYSDSAVYGLHHLACSLRSREGGREIQLGLRNVFNTHHEPYLAPPLFAPGEPATPLPGPGREWILAARLRF
jgi:outer membrane receptor protein involved in Fe transport